MPDFSEFLQCPKTVFFCSRGDKQFYVNPHPKSREPLFSANWDVLSKKEAGDLQFCFAAPKLSELGEKSKFDFHRGNFSGPELQDEMETHVVNQVSDSICRKRLLKSAFAKINSIPTILENESLAPYFLFSKIRVKLALNLEPLKAAILIRSLSSGNPIKVKST